MNILVTGGAGFIGSNLALELQKYDNKVTIADNFFSGDRQNLKEFKGEIINKDLSEKIKTKQKFDVIFHQAAITDPRHDNDDETYNKNVKGFLNIINFAKKNNSKLIYASSGSIYGNTKTPMQENQEKQIFGAYANSKFEIDQIAEKEFNNMHIVGLRYFNVFGPKESHKGRPASMIYHLRNQILKGENPKLFKSGEQKRDHIYVDDVINVNMLAMNSESGVYNVGTGIATSFNDLIKIINKVLDTNEKIEYINNPYEETYQTNTQADTTKAEKFLNFKVTHSLEQRINQYYDYLDRTKELLVTFK